MSTSALTWIDISPAQTQREKELGRSNAASHAAKAVYARKKQASEWSRSARNGGHGRVLKPATRSQRSATLEVQDFWEQQSRKSTSGVCCCSKNGPWQENTGSQGAGSKESDDMRTLTSITPFLEGQFVLHGVSIDGWDAIAYRPKPKSAQPTSQIKAVEPPASRGTRSLRHNEHDSEPTKSMQLVASSKLPLIISPQQRPDFQSSQLPSLEFFLSSLGHTVRHNADKLFFNVVVPCLSERSNGIRELVSAIAMTYKAQLSSTTSSSAYQTQALSHFASAIRYFGQQDPVQSSPEVLQAWCILMAAFYSLRLEPASAEKCIRMGTNLCGVDSETLLDQRKRNEQHTKDRSWHGEVILRTIVKREVEVIPMLAPSADRKRRQKHDGSSEATEDCLDQTSSNTAAMEDSLPILLIPGIPFEYPDPPNYTQRLMYNIGAVLNLYKHLISNTSMDARIDPECKLAKDLLRSFQAVLTWFGYQSPSLPRQERSTHTVGVQAPSLSQTILESTERTDPIAAATLEEQVDSEGRNLPPPTNAMLNFLQWPRYQLIELSTSLLLPLSTTPEKAITSYDTHTTSFNRIVLDITHYLACSSSSSQYIYYPTGIAVRPLFFAAIHCRDPDIRRRAIACLKRHHRNEAGLDSWLAGCFAEEVMTVEQHGLPANLKTAGEISAQNRIIIRDFDYIPGSERVAMLYTLPASADPRQRRAIMRHKFEIPEDPHGVVRSRKPRMDVEDLRLLLASVSRAWPEDAPHGYMRKMWYCGEEVVVRVR